MYYAIVSAEGEYLQGESQGELHWGKLRNAAVFPAETRHLWSGLNRSTPSIDELLEEKKAALVPHPNYKFYGMDSGYAVYEVCGDPNYRVVAGALFPPEKVPEEPQTEEEMFEIKV